MASKKGKSYKTVDPDQVPEVAGYEQAMRVLDFFRDSNRATFEEYAILAGEANQKLEAAAAVVRSRQINCGDFKVHSTSVKYDVGKLQALIGKEAFMELGGVSKTQVSWDIDRARLETAVDTGKLSEDVVEAVRTISVSFKMPKPL